ncbi:endonuclease/exonuclease/phosphatase family protein [Nocardioides guangzhouensis]|uniref:endonuclease/exonuclease/phosphatase family protein n=1 Tax=Nocardioides guangzhouensis TaxID=2497878 RepID=UPI001438439B|nr:endonuclease/exonuclease/phosphatase family protein [Nocardioides guangzhouensis]
MRKPPELVLMLAPALLVTAVVVAFGFVVAPSDDSETAAGNRRPTTSATISTHEPEPTSGAATPQAGARTGKLTGPRVTLELKPKPKFKVYDPYSFTIATFNVLGHSHTKPGGNRKGYASSATRMGWAVGLINGQSADIVGLQEFQQPQFNNFVGRTGGAWGVWPGMAVGNLGVENSIAWRKDVFTAVQTQTVGIPYFGGQERRMPYVLLQHNATGQRLWVANFHNPADTADHGQNGGSRRAATAREIALANELSASGYPVFFTGDFNDRADYFCPLTANTTLKAANGGSTGSGCAPPPRMQVDWIFGSDAVSFSGYRVIDGGLVNRTSDHPLVAAEVAIPGRKVPLERARD